MQREQSPVAEVGARATARHTQRAKRRNRVSTYCPILARATEHYDGSGATSRVTGDRPAMEGDHVGPHRGHGEAGIDGVAGQLGVGTPLTHR